MRRIVAIRCQAVEGSARKASTVWRQVATATGGYGVCTDVRAPVKDGSDR